MIIKNKKGFLSVTDGFIILLIIVIVAAIGLFRMDNWEEAADKEQENPISTVTLEYGDSYSFSDKVVAKADGAENILKFSSKNQKKIKAIECGNTDVKLKSGENVNVKVEPARIALVLFAGQSNCEGRLSSYETIEQARERVVLNEPMTAFDTYGASDNETSEEVNWIQNPIEALSIESANKYIPESLTDNSKNEIYNRTDTLTAAKGETGKTGIDSAFAYEWYKNSGEKVWIVNAAHHGSTIESWEATTGEIDNNFWQSVKLYQCAEKLLSEEIEAGHFILARKGIIWCQGENNFNMSSNEYVSRFQEMFEGFEEHLNGKGISDLERDLDFCGILIVRAAMNKPDNDKDLVLTGPRSSQFYMTMKEGDSKILLASNVAENWSDDKSVKKYFTEKYGNDKTFNKAYPKENTNVKMPERVKDVHGGFHFSQLGYNEIGFDAADSIWSAVAKEKKTDKSLKWLELVTDDGITDRSGETITITADRYVPFAAKAFPASMQKEIEITCSDNVEFNSNGLMIKSDGAKGEVTGQIEVKAGEISKIMKIIGR